MTKGLAVALLGIAFVFVTGVCFANMVNAKNNGERYGDPQSLEDYRAARGTLPLTAFVAFMLLVGGMRAHWAANEEGLKRRLLGDPSRPMAGNVITLYPVR